VEQLVSLRKPDALAVPESVARPAVLPPHTERPRDGERLASGKVYVEIVRGAPPAEIDRDWRDLVARADEPNVFMQPSVLRAAQPDRPLVTLLAWEPRGDGRRLSGFWAFSIGKPHLSILPITALCAPATQHAYLSSPVIDRGCLDAVLNGMLDAIAQAPDLPHFVALESISGSGATCEALLRVVAGRKSQSRPLDGKNRPVLMPSADAASYLEKAFSGSSRKKLRQHRRRLAEKGKLETTVTRSVVDVQRAFEAFLALEAKGWKGKRGTALLSDPDQAAFARNMVTALARAGDASVHALELDGRPISMQVVLRAGPAAFTWKTAYDEDLRDYSPGMLLFEDCSKALLADPSIAFADSCAFDDTGYMAAWIERKRVIDLWIDPRRGESAAFSMIAGAQQRYLGLRETAKQAYLRSASLQRLRHAASALRRIVLKRGEKAPSKTKRLAGAF
jgi:hypothetical protein